MNPSTSLLSCSHTGGERAETIEWVHVASPRCYVPSRVIALNMCVVCSALALRQSSMLSRQGIRSNSCRSVARGPQLSYTFRAPCQGSAAASGSLTPAHDVSSRLCGEQENTRLELLHSHLLRWHSVVHGCVLGIPTASCGAFAVPAKMSRASYKCHGCQCVSAASEWPPAPIGCVIVCACEWTAPLSSLVRHVLWRLCAAQVGSH